MRILKKFAILSLIISISLCYGCVRPHTHELSDTHFIMDTVCTIRIGGSDKSELTSALNSAFDRIYEISNLTDYYSEKSQVNAINTADSYQPVSVSEDVFFIISKSLEIGELSNGAFDITVAPLKDLWAFNKGDHAPPDTSDIKSKLAEKGMEKLVLDEMAKTVTKTESNVKIDLGGCAKGYAADSALDVIKQYNISYCLIDLGGNILTYGDNPASKDNTWNIGIQEPFTDNGVFSQTLSVQNAAVVTSGTYQRYFTWDSKQYHHILDPESGFPTDNGINSVTVVSQSAFVADCLSTSCLVLGYDKGKELSERLGVEVYFR